MKLLKTKTILNYMLRLGIARPSSLLCIVLFFVFFGGSINVSAQIASDGFENATTLFTISGTSGTTGYRTGTTSASDRVASTPYAVAGSYSYGVYAGTSVLTSSAINTAGYSSIQMSLRLLAVSSNNSSINGVKTADNVLIDVSPDGGTTWYPTIKVTGSGASGANWSYAGASGTASTAYDGNGTLNTTLTPAGTGTRTTDGYSTMTITSLPAIATLKFRISIASNGGNTALWCIDDFNVTGVVSASLSTSALTAFGNVCVGTTAGPNSFTITGTNLTSANVTVASLSDYTYSTSAGGSYTSTLSLVQSGGSYGQTIYVKFTPSSSGSISGNIVVGGGGASSVNCAASGTGVTTPTTSVAGTDQTICGTTATLAGNNPSVGIGTWTLLSGSGTITSNTTYNSGLTSLGAGDNKFIWTIGGGSCTNSRDTVTIHADVAVPTVVSNTTPTSGSTIAASPVFIYWANGGGATSYTMNLGTSSPPATSYGSQSGLYFGAGALTPNTTYYWRVDATNACGTTNGTIWNFTTLPNFSNTTTAACDAWDSGNNYTGFTRSISVTGLPTTLGTGSGQYVLNEIEIDLGSNACKQDLSTYNFRLIAPNGTTALDFFSSGGLTTTTSSVWAKVKFRDNAALERINEYSSTVQTGYFPYSIGYYAISTDNGFQSTFNGLNPNGTWTFAIKENDATEIAFNAVTLKFGPAIYINDVSGQSIYDNCSSSQCIDLSGVVVATNDGFVNGDPIFTSLTVNGCGYNGANNNSAWFQFTANQTTAYITISGMKATSGSGSADLQPIIVQAPSSCAQPTIVPTGGCADDESINNRAYANYAGNMNGGGTTSSGNIYSNGITANCEFNLSGLSVGQKYYLYIDGNSGASGTYYIEGLRGIATSCDLPLAIELVDFKAKCKNGSVKLEWTTSAEINNDYFSIEKSTNLEEWKEVAKVKGSGNSTKINSYKAVDVNVYDKEAYYRIKQTDYDGKYSYSENIKVRCSGELIINVYPNPSNGLFNIEGLEQDVDNLLSVYDYTGKLLVQNSVSEEKFSLNLTSFPSGIYFVMITSNGNNYSYKLLNQTNEK